MKKNRTAAKTKDKPSQQAAPGVYRLMSNGLSLAWVVMFLASRSPVITKIFLRPDPFGQWGPEPTVFLWSAIIVLILLFWAAEGLAKRLPQRLAKVLFLFICSMLGLNFSFLCMLWPKAFTPAIFLAPNIMFWLMSGFIGHYEEDPTSGFSIGVMTAAGVIPALITNLIFGGGWSGLGLGLLSVALFILTAVMALKEYDGMGFDELGVRRGPIFGALGVLLGLNLLCKFFLGVIEICE